MAPRKVLAASACSIAAFGLLALAVGTRFPPLTAFDAAISTAARHYALAHPGWVTAMKVVTEGGDGAVLYPLAVLAAVVLAALRRWRALGLVLTAAVASPAIRYAVSLAFTRTRPPGGFVAPSGWSFPSGHTNAAATGALLLAIVLWPYARRSGWRFLLAGLAVLWPLAVGVSRVALVVHWPTDVIGSLLLAAGVVGLLGWLWRIPQPAPAQS